MAGRSTCIWKDIATVPVFSSILYFNLNFLTTSLLHRDLDYMKEKVDLYIGEKGGMKETTFPYYFPLII